MTRIYLMMFMCFAFAKAVSAQSSTADKLLNEVATKYKAYDNVVFTYKGNLKNERAKFDTDIQGEAKLSGNMYNATYNGTTYMYDGSKLYTINREDEQVTITKQVSDGSQMINPSNIMTFYEKGYTREMDIIQNVKGRKIQYVKLTPIKSDSEYKNILLGVDANTKHIYNAIITERSGTIITFTLKSFKPNETLPKNSFIFDASQYDNWDIEEMD
ncbi:LolA family protein [Nonlabens ponticola]|uniref:Outer membrane lipoprotein carrier protein LolA n=1 Tax=Nonlabens ponticola TaxID=2496866 RepID=A0A3S9N018_9FLAO|nr:outer membrane lipoprotein carrier protein LolA [Nonlabens ponticola]AZQ44673.1 outer membrane lipoprotein carrier protein LolA [Nonlabens ponticola]